MKVLRIHRKRETRAFTLIEMLVVLALLGVVLTITVTISNGSIEMISKTRARISADEIAATAFDQLSLDLNQRLVRREATVRVVKRPAGNDELVMLTARSGYPVLSDRAERRASAVHYRVQKGGLVQASCGYDFGDSGVEPDEKNGALRLFDLPEEGPADLRDGWFETMVPGVVRMEFSVIGGDGEERLLADAPEDFREVESLVVTLVVLDPKRTRYLKQEHRERLAKAFPDARDGELAKSGWVAVERDLAARLPGSEFPRAALRHVRVYQRCIPLRTSSAL